MSGQSGTDASADPLLGTPCVGGAMYGLSIVFVRDHDRKLAIVFARVVKPTLV
jgi:hypothetical protein